MVKVKEDLVGKVFTRLEVIKQTDDFISSNGDRLALWMCRCLCGNQNIVLATGKSLKAGEKTSCGCLTRELRTNNEKEYNKYNLSGNFGIGWTLNTNAEFYFDLEDYDKIKDYCWYEHINKDGYRSLQTNIHIGENKNRSTVKMHWLLVGKYYDHADRNPLNNQKTNLRPATSQENARNHNKQKNNTSGIIGVCWHKSKQMWVASITINKKKMQLGSSINKEEATRMRLNAEAKYFGEFAPQRHLFEQYNIKLIRQGS